MSEQHDSKTEGRGAIPDGVYFSEDNFYSIANRRGMGWDFYNKWRSRISEFPTSPSPLASVEAGRGEREALERAVAWQYRYKFKPSPDAGVDKWRWSQWTNCSEKAANDLRGENCEVRPLYAAPPSQPEGVREALEAALRWIDAIPNDVADALPAMPGFDRDWVNSVLATTPSPGLVEAAEWHEAQMKHHERVSGAPRISEYHFHKQCAEHFRTLSAKGGVCAG